MRHCIFSVVLALSMISMSERVGAQTNSNSSGTLSWPANPPVGIGTQRSFGAVPQNALHIHYDPSLFPNPTLPAMMRLSEGDSTNMQTFGLLGLMPTGTTTYSSLSTGGDLILHEHQGGDIIITNYSTINAAFANGTAIRLATTSDSAHRPLFPPMPHDLERQTIDRNGNIGFDLPPDTTTGLGNPLEQVEIGGGVVPPPGYTTPVPGLTIYGGSRLEGMALPSGPGTFPYSYRTIHFNTYGNHQTNAGNRIAPLSSCGIDFSDIAGGLLDFNCWPYDSTRGLNDFSHELTLQVNGTGGMFLWYYQDSTHPYHHIFDAFLPGVTSWPVTRNTNGLFIHHTPVYITSDSTSTPSCDFQNLPVHPNIGDGSTWDLVVNGPALFKEAYVNLDWPDFVFDPNYTLPPLDSVKRFIDANHHLPDVPSAKEMAKTGVPLGQTEAKMMQKIEELTEYVIEQDKKVEKLEADIQELQNQKGK